MLTRIVLSTGIALACGAAYAQGGDKVPGEEKKPSLTREEMKDVGTEAGDRSFVERAASDNMADIELGKLALEKSSNPKVKKFARQMIHEHTRANRELKGMAIRKGWSLPADVTTEQKQNYDKLKEKSGKDFDKAFLDQAAKDYSDQVPLFQEQANAGHDPNLKAWAGRTLPMLRAQDVGAHAEHDAL
jgi:putative membrane protein